MPIATTPNVKEGSPVQKKTTSKVQDTTFYTVTPLYTFDDMILPPEVKAQMDDAIAMKKYQQIIYETWGLGKIQKSPKHIYINLYGAPGTGKTMAAHAIASQLEQKLICVNYAEIESKYVGETAKNLLHLFEMVKQQAVILFFDEADALLSKRVTDMSSSTDVSVNQTRSVLLNLLDKHEGMVIFTTNFISNYDPAFMRRINYHIQIPLPDEALRLKLWQRYIPPEMPAQVNCAELAQKYEGITGNDIANAVVMAALRAARLGCDVILQSFFEDAVKNIQASIAQNRQPDRAVHVEEREVSKEYVQQQLGKNIK